MNKSGSENLLDTVFKGDGSFFFNDDFLFNDLWLFFNVRHYVLLVWFKVYFFLRYLSGQFAEERNTFKILSS